MLLTSKNSSCSCCPIICLNFYKSCLQPDSPKASVKSCQLLSSLSAKLKLLLQMTIIFSQISSPSRASSDVNRIGSKNHSFLHPESLNFYSQVPPNHRMNSDQMSKQVNNKFGEQSEEDSIRTYFSNYKPFESNENQELPNQLLIDQSSFLSPLTYEKQEQSKKRQLINNFVPQSDDQPLEKKSNQQVSKWSISFNEEPHQVFHSKRINLPEKTTLSYGNTINRHNNDSSSPVLSSAVHFDDEYDHRRSQSQPLATVATPRGSSKDSELETQQIALKQAQLALDENLALQDKLVELLNKAKSSSPPATNISRPLISNQYLPTPKSSVVSKPALSIKVDNLISLKQSDEMMRGIVPMRRFVQRPRHGLSGIRFPTNLLNYNTNHHHLSVDSNSNSQAQPATRTDLKASNMVADLPQAPVTELKHDYDNNNNGGNGFNMNRYSVSDDGVAVVTSNVAGNLNGAVSPLQPQTSSLADVVTMKQPVAVTRVGSREEPLIVVTAPSYNYINNNVSNNDNDEDSSADDDERSSDRLFKGQDKLQADSTTKTPTVVNGNVVTTWLATNNDRYNVANRNSNKNYVATTANTNKETFVGSFAQPSSNLNDLAKMEKFYNPKFYDTQQQQQQRQQQMDLLDFYGDGQEKMVPNSKAELVDFDHNEFDQIFNTANNEQAKQFQKSHLYPTTTNIDHQQQNNNPESDYINNNIIESDFNPSQQSFERQKQQQLPYDDWPITTIATTTSGAAATREADLVEQPVSSYSNGYNTKHNRHHHHSNQQKQQQQQLNYRDNDEDYPSTNLSQQQQQQQSQLQQRKRSRLKRPHLKSKHLMMAQNQNHAIYNRKKRLFYDYHSPTTPNHLLGGVSLAYQPSVAQGSYADYYNGNDGSPSYQVVHVHSKEKKSHGKYLWPIVGGGLTMLMGFLIISNILLSIPLLAIGASSLFNQGGHHSQQLVPVYNLSQLVTTRPPSGRRRRRRRRRKRSVYSGIEKSTRIFDLRPTRERRVSPKNDLEARIERFIDGIVKSSSVGASRLFSGFGLGWNRRQLLKTAYCHWPNRIRQQQFG